MEGKNEGKEEGKEGWGEKERKERTVISNSRKMIATASMQF